MDSTGPVDKSAVVSYSIPDTSIDILTQSLAFKRSLASWMVSSIVSAGMNLHDALKFRVSLQGCVGAASTNCADHRIAVQSRFHPGALLSQVRTDVFHHKKRKSPLTK
ncbi:hypothetical protein AVEN_251159-1 [Araneus ventricosus]|uniref:Uncharacterized protein n=1 Tax=Araneus ventricosus TaxID=182803 RepID=A0A4Y2I7P1_ARAVE|nr:hypothetical protein AVEN_251159-1 [Araneus ventricosus]